MSVIMNNLADPHVLYWGLIPNSYIQLINISKIPSLLIRQILILLQFLNDPILPNVELLLRPSSGRLYALRLKL